jgi:predicted RNA methylase
LIKGVRSQYFSEFFKKLYPKIEGHFQDQLNRSLSTKKLIDDVLIKVSWVEWQKTRIEFIKPLTTVLIALLYDKILLSIKKLENTNSIYEFLDEMTTLVGINVEKSLENRRKAHFISSLEQIWISAHKEDPQTPILDQESFPLNKILSLIFFDWDICLVIINFVSRIINKKNYQDQLILPYFFEVGIPNIQKQTEGQVFTPLKVVDFICHQNISNQTKRILDPACGTGLFLLGALRLIRNSSNKYNFTELIGIEKDPFLAAIAESSINYFIEINSLTFLNSRIINSDFFDCSKESLGISSDDPGATTLLMNPPYTRHEKLPSDYKKFLNQQLALTIEKLQNSEETLGKYISGRSGLYVYFLIHATSFLTEKDNFGLIIPNSWMDVDYGHKLQLFFLANYFIKSIINCRLEKLIPSVDVNAAILRLKRRKINPMTNEKKVSNIVKFTSIDKVADLKLINDFEKIYPKDSPQRVHILSLEQKALFSESKWGAYLRAPSIYIQLMKNLDKKLVSLGNIANIRRGFTTGANDFFYLGKPGMSNSLFQSIWDPDSGNLKLSIKDETVVSQFKEQGLQIKKPYFVIEKEYWMHRIDFSHGKSRWEYSFKDNNGDVWVPNYLIKSPKDLSNYEIQEKDTRYIVLLIPPQSNENGLKRGIQEYISWGEEWNPSIGKKYSDRPTCRSRKNWYELPTKECFFFSLLCLMTINDRFVFFYNPDGYYFDARLYGIQILQLKGLRNSQILKYYFLFLNSVLTTAQLELIGRSNLGEGGLDVKVYEYNLIKVPKPEFFTNISSEEINESFLRILKLKPFSIIQQKPKLLKEITNNLITNIFSLTPSVLNKLLDELKEIVQFRLVKARSASHN